MTKEFRLQLWGYQWINKNADILLGDSYNHGYSSNDFYHWIVYWSCHASVTYFIAICFVEFVSFAVCWECLNFQAFRRIVFSHLYLPTSLNNAHFLVLSLTNGYEHYPSVKFKTCLGLSRHKLFFFTYFNWLKIK